MALTYDEALTAREFHYNGPDFSAYARIGAQIQCERHIGPRGGVHITQLVARRNGRTQTWRTRPGEYRIPVKIGLRDYGQITHRDAQYWHTPETCPLHTE